MEYPVPHKVTADPGPRRQNAPTPSHHAYLSGWGSVRLQSQVIFFMIFWKPNRKETVTSRVLFIWPRYAKHSCGYQISPSVYTAGSVRSDTT